MTNLPLRERKYAATKAALMQGLVSRLAQQTLDEITVKEVCAEIPVSETTFFNYFPSKQAAIGYRIQLWSIRTLWEMQQQIAQGGTYLDAIATIFDSAAQGEEQNPGVMREVVAFQVSQKFDFQPLIEAEYVHHFPDLPGITQVEGQSIDRMIGDQLEAAQQSGELPLGVDLPALTAILIGVFFISPVMLSSGQSGSLRDFYRRQLNILFRLTPKP
ncbi:MAG: TetR/AcrR family transcriptional regulator [Anaerolineaceae bacterium]|nr:TetR/AcrR family transcriptional regulator [Anaerolineaceae bacterium]